MDIKLIAANLEDLNTILQMQKEAFSELYAKYQDTETSPGKNMRIFCSELIKPKRHTTL